MMQKISVVIMASGLSKRMGKNKLWLTFKGQTFLERTMTLVSSMHFHEIILVIDPNEKNRCLVPKNVKIVYNRDNELGQSQAVKLGMRYVTGDGVLFLPVDQPLLTKEILTEILKHADAEQIVLPVTKDGLPKSPVFFGKSFFEELSNVTGDTGGRSVREGHKEDWIRVFVDDSMLIDIDTPLDYEKLLQEEDK